MFKHDGFSAVHRIPLQPPLSTWSRDTLEIASCCIRVDASTFVLLIPTNRKVPR